MGSMARRPRVPLRSPYFRSMAKQARLCPACGRRTRLNGLELSPDAAYEVCDGPGCDWFQTLEAPGWARVGGGRAARKAAPGRPALSVVEGGRA